MLQIENFDPEHINGPLPVMVDLETVGTGANSGIISIGACTFDPDTQLIGSTFHAIINRQSCFDIGCTFDQSTIDWWGKQSTEARAASYDYKDGLSVQAALLAFSDWFPGQELWGNGSDFDNAMLAELYRKAGLEQPWKFWNNRCYRTMKNQFPAVALTRHGTHHNAVDDAVTQAKHLMKILQRIRNMRAALG